MGTINCLHLKVNLKWKSYQYVNSTAQTCPNKIIKTLDFFHLPPVSTTPMLHLELQISWWIYKKIWNAINGILRGLGETDTWKKSLSLIPVCPWHRQQICHWCHWHWWKIATGINDIRSKSHRWQIMGMINCLHLKVNLKETIIKWTWRKQLSS